MSKITHKHLKNNDHGVVAIFVALLIMIIISLIVLGFAKLSRREQRAALDKQLSTQAFYAAETAINDAIDVLQSGKFASDNTDYSKNCNAFITKYLPANAQTINGQAGVSYTCLLLDSAPNALDYGDVETNHSLVIPIQSSDPANLVNKITIGWQNKAASATAFNKLGCPTVGTFPDLGSWSCDQGVLRVDVVPAANLNRSNLQTNTYTTFVYPKTGGNGKTSYQNGIGSVGDISEGKCTPSDAPLCTIDISVPAADYFLRVRSLYRPSSIHIVGNDGKVDLVGAEITLDATGKAQDILRRLQVHKSVFTSSDFPEFAVQTSDTICKRFGVFPGGAVFDRSNVSAGVDTSACDPNVP